MSGERVTAAVVVKDRRELMARCLDALLRQDLDAPFEIVVVDNGSTDGTAELVRARAVDASVPIRVVDCPGPIGRARNAAVAAAGAPIVAFTDSDCEPEPGWLRAGLDALERAPEVGVVQGRTTPPVAAARGRWSATQELTAFTNRYETCNVFYRRDALVDAGGFDESIGFFGEDTAAGWAVRRSGWDARFADEAVVRHVVTQPGLAWHLKRALRYGNVNALVRRFPEMRRQLLWSRVFLRPRSAAFTALVAGAALSAVERRFLVLTLPYLWLRRPKGMHRSDLVDAAGATAFDAAVFAGLLRGCVRERTVVL
jgi:cellulose synthase/poly-beta-1,6-N-acetylglucosamine synthase-like glycosyltransferase